MIRVISTENCSMQYAFEGTLRRTTIFRGLSADDRRRLSAIASIRQFEKGEALFREGDASDQLVTVLTGRVKVVKTTARGTDVILEIELTNRLTELSGGKVEARLARFFLKLAGDLGQIRDAGTFIPMVLSRQELADLMGTTIETTIRIMSRWGKDDIVLTERDGFLVRDRSTLESVAIG
jgi:CRP-like cAMP-binding protein